MTEGEIIMRIIKKGIIYLLEIIIIFMEMEMDKVIWIIILLMIIQARLNFLMISMLIKKSIINNFILMDTL